jgi:hypothetical protein
MAIIAMRRFTATVSPHASELGSALVRYSLNPSAMAASGAEKPAKNDTHPVRKPKIGWNCRDRYTYSPPARGIAAPRAP